jgi:hypothetical protein
MFPILGIATKTFVIYGVQWKRYILYASPVYCIFLVCFQSNAKRNGNNRVGWFIYLCVYISNPRLCTHTYTQLRQYKCQDSISLHSIFVECLSWFPPSIGKVAAHTASPVNSKNHHFGRVDVFSANCEECDGLLKHEYYWKPLGKHN